jgi:hypothetical protein
VKCASVASETGRVRQDQEAGKEFCGYYRGRRYSSGEEQGGRRNDPFWDRPARAARVIIEEFVAVRARRTNETCAREKDEIEPAGLGGGR